MDNIFGITEDDIVAFEAAQNEIPPKLTEARAELEALAREYTASLDDPEWYARAKIIAMLPGLENRMKAAAIFLGFPHLMGQVFLIHTIAQGSLTTTDALVSFTLYCKAVGISQAEISSWLALYFSLGILGRAEGHNTGTLDDSTVIPGGTMYALAVASASNLQATLETMEYMVPYLETLGIEFGSDPALLANLVEDPVTSIDSLAPDLE